MDNQSPQPTASPTPNPQPTGGTPPAKSPGLMAPKKDQSAKNKRFILGCLAAFGCSIVLFIALLFIFLGVGTGPESPLSALFGVPSGEVVNVLISLTNLLFGFLAFVAFVVGIIGVFKISTTKKEDKEGKKKGMAITIGGLSTLVLLTAVWIFSFLFLSSKQTISEKRPIITEPAVTTNLTAPVTIAFDATKLAVPRGVTVLKYLWDFGDGETATGSKQSHTYQNKGKDNGLFKVTLTITAKELATGKEFTQTFTHDVSIANVRAQAIIKADPLKGEAPLTVSFDASDSSSPNGELIGFAWDFDGDGEYDDSTKAEDSRLFDKVGTYKVGLQIRDSSGEFATSEQPIEVTEPTVPQAEIVIEDPDGVIVKDALTVKVLYTFNGAGSLSPAGEIEKYTWDFGDGTEKKQVRVVSHAFQQVGEYEVTLEVVDLKGNKGKEVKRVKVVGAESAPVAVIKTLPNATDGVISGEAPFEISFDATESKDPNDNIVEFQWDFDGDSKKDSSDPQTTYFYQKIGEYTATLKVIDAKGNEAKTSLRINVTPQGIHAKLVADPVSGEVPLTVAFDASGSRYAEGQIVSYEWDFGDGAEPKLGGASISHKYTAIGTFKAKVTVSSSDGKKATTEIPITIRPVALKACFTMNHASSKTPLEVEFDPSCSTGTIVKYKWTFADLGTSIERKPKFTFEKPGSYEVTLEVSDNQNVVHTFKSTLTVNP